jgi:hypothetical protein
MIYSNKYSQRYIYIYFKIVFNQKVDARVIVGVFYENEARKVFCQVILFIFL